MRPVVIYGTKQAATDAQNRILELFNLPKINVAPIATEKSFSSSPSTAASANTQDQQKSHLPTIVAPSVAKKRLSDDLPSRAAAANAQDQILQQKPYLP